MVKSRCCRVCEKKYNLLPIFEKGNEETLRMLRSIASSPVGVNDGLPQHICLKCKHELQMAYDFRLCYAGTFAKMLQLLKYPAKYARKVLSKEDAVKKKVIAKKSTKRSSGNHNEDGEGAAHSLTDGDDQRQAAPSSDLGNKTYGEIYKTKINIIGEKEASRRGSTYLPSDYLKQEISKQVDALNSAKCGKSAVNLHRQQTLIALNLNRIYYKCKKCEKSFRTERSMREHKCELTKCTECGKTFSKAITLRTHLALHKNPHLYRCDKCGKSFRSASYLQEHEPSHFGLSKCNQCGKSFSRLRSLKLHLSLHLNPDIYKCDKCGRSFQTAESLKGHAFSHSALNKCSECGKEFQREEDLSRHLVLHLNPKLFECTVCGKTLSSSKALKQHQTTHSNIDIQYVDC